MPSQIHSGGQNFNSSVGKRQMDQHLKKMQTDHGEHIAKLLQWDRTKESKMEQVSRDELLRKRAVKAKQDIWQLAEEQAAERTEELTYGKDGSVVKPKSKKKKHKKSKKKKKKKKTQKVEETAQASAFRFGFQFGFQLKFRFRFKFGFRLQF
eukprot:505715_1